MAKTLWPAFLAGFPLSGALGFIRVKRYCDVIAGFCGELGHCWAMTAFHYGNQRDLVLPHGHVRWIVNCSPEQKPNAGNSGTGSTKLR